MDNLKKYLLEHREEMDTDVPGEAVWQRIQKDATPVLPKRNIIKLVFRYAAAACVLLCIAAGAFLLGKKQTGTETAVNTDTITHKPSPLNVLVQPKNVDSAIRNTSSDVVKSGKEQKANPAELYVKKESSTNKPVIIKKKITIDPAQLMVQDIENNYGQLVNMQLQQLRITPVYAESPDYFSSFKQQFKQIEEDEKAIKKEIRLHGLNDELLQQLININQQKLNVLKGLQTEISKLNNKVKQPQNRQDSSQSFYLNM